MTRPSISGLDEFSDPRFFEQLVAALRGPEPSIADLDAIGEAAALHGGRLQGEGRSISQVVRSYQDLCLALTDLAREVDSTITPDEFRVLSICLAGAVTEAVAAYMRVRDKAVSEETQVRTGILAHELRNRLAAATLAFELIRKGKVAPGGGVSALISRNHAHMSSLIQRSMAAVRVTSGIEHRQRLPVATLLDEMEAEGALEAAARKQTFTVTPVDQAVEIEVDREIVAGAISNLVHNAFKFTRSGGHIALKTTATERRVRMDVEDECGGLPPGKPHALFEAFEQRGHDRSGLGLGLYISRKGIEANDGLLDLRDIPGHGCVFTIDLPRVTSPAA